MNARPASSPRKLGKIGILFLPHIPLFIPYNRNKTYSC